MPTTTFTTRIDVDLKEKLEQIAKNEDRSASYMANQAIRALVEEREATRELVQFAVDNLDRLEHFGEDDVTNWLQSSDGKPFPDPINR